MYAVKEADEQKAIVTVVKAHHILLLAKLRGLFLPTVILR